jgi:hypothetical protein
MSAGPTLRPGDPAYRERHPVAHALRTAGFMPVPRFWIPGEAMPELLRLVNRYRREVNEIRASVHTELGFEQPEDFGPFPVGLTSDETDDPRFNKDAAWAAVRKLR